MCLQCGRPGFDPLVGKVPWRRKWQPTPVFLPGESHGQRSLVDYSPRVAKSQTPLSDFTSLHFSSKKSTCQCWRCRFNPWVRKIPWRRKWQPTPIFLPGKSHRQGSLASYSPWGHKRVGHNLVTKQQQCYILSS